MSLTMLFFAFAIEIFPAESWWFNLEMKSIGWGYQGFYDERMKRDYIWSLMRETYSKIMKRK